MRTKLTFINRRSCKGEGDDARSGQRLVLDDDYQLGARLGRGGMGDVWAGLRQSDGRDVAVKILHPHLASLERRAEREAQVLARLPSGCAPRPIAYGCSKGGEICLVMERLFGEDLARRLSRPQALPAAEALGIVTGVARVLDAAHDLGVVHRDLKPSNVFLCDAANQALDLRVLDFGIAHVAQHRSDILTLDGDFVGSPGYLAPEQVLGCVIGPHTDVFALAALAYRLLTGHAAFSSRSRVEAAFQAVHTEPAPASRVRPGLPMALDAVLAGALAKSPRERPARAGDLAVALAAALA